jgi:hypothetical protein
VTTQPLNIYINIERTKKMIKLSKQTLYYYDGVLYESTEELKETFKDKEEEALEVSGNILIKELEKASIIKKYLNDLLKIQGGKYE